jgi:hypothetical protein
MDWLINIMETQGPQLVAMRAEAEERLMDRRIREEQDAAYQVGVRECSGWRARRRATDRYRIVDTDADADADADNDKDTRTHRQKGRGVGWWGKRGERDESREFGRGIQEHKG